MLKHIILGSLLLAVGASSASAQDRRVYSYPADGEPVQYFGDSKAQTYDIAIKLANPALVGKKVSAVTVALCESASVSDPRGWLSSALLLDSKKKNAPDIELVEAVVSDDNVLTATFSEPYVVPEEGVYVGYSITIPKAATFGDQNPNPVAFCVNTDGAYIHSTRTNLKWSSLSEYNVASCMEVTLEGNFPEYAVEVNGVGTVRTDGKSAVVDVPMTLCNTGASEVNSIEVSYQYGDNAPQTTEYQLPDPVSAKFCSMQKVVVPIPSYPESTSLKIAVTKVNGEPNTFAASETVTQYVVMAFVPVCRPLMEEYTGLWCGWCPRGWVAMEMMSELYPEDFVCVSYHDGDEMQYLDSYPEYPQGFPSAYLNRGEEIDPYYGDGNTPFGIRQIWESLRAEECPADIEAWLDWADEEHSTLVCSSKIRFIEDVDGADYRVDYILTGNGFRSITVYDEDGKVDNSESLFLLQSNYYSGETAPDNSELWSQFVNGGSKVPNLVYNDVAMSISPIGGEEALPSEVKANEVYTHQYEIHYPSIQSLYTYSNILPEDGELRCVAVLTTADGRFVNCNKSQPIRTSGVREVIGSNAVAESTEWYDIQGRRLETPGKGMMIRVDRLSDGSRRTAKVVAK